MRESVEKCKERIKNDDFLFGEEAIVKFYGKEMIERLKKEDPQTYCFLRDDAMYMPSDVIKDKNPAILQKYND